MTFSKELREAAQPIIEDIYNDGFIQDLLAGTLSKQAVRQYLRADASYLKEFSNLYALLVPKVPTMEDVKFLVEQIEFMLEGEVEAHEVLADYINEPYNEIVKEKVWPPSGDHYIKHMYYNAYAHENAAYTIAAMAPCPYVYAVVAKRAIKDPALNRDSITAKWFDFYSTEMDPLVEVFDQLMDRLTEECTKAQKKKLKKISYKVPFMNVTSLIWLILMKNGISEEKNMNKPKIALTIAGTDPTGGAGVMADLKSFHSCGVYGMAAITSIVAQNTLGVQHIHNLETSWVKEQLESVFDDELPHAIKTGMIATKETMELIQTYLERYSDIPYVIDPVMLAKSGDSLMDDDTKSHLQSTLLPLADVVTPNIPEAEEITGLKIDNEESIRKAGDIFINEIGSKGVVIKGGHSADLNNAKDFLFTKDDVYTFENKRFDTKHTHGTGCTFSAVITAELAKGRSIYEAVKKAKAFISMSIEHTRNW